MPAPAACPNQCLFSRAPIELWMLRFTSSAFNEWFVTTQIDHILRSLYSWNYEWLRFMRFLRVIPSHCYQTCLNFLTLYTRYILCNSGMQTTILFTSFRPYTESQETKKAETLGFISLFWKQNSLRNISSQLYDLVKLFCCFRNKHWWWLLRLQLGITHPQLFTVSDVSWIV